MKNTITVNTETMTLEDYEKLYDIILAVSFDADGYSLDGSFDNDEIEKCQLIRNMIECLDDVPKGRTEWILDGLWKKHLPKEMWYQERKRKNKESQI